MKTKEGLEISLENTYTHKSYSVFYKDIEYIYEFDYNDGLFDNEFLTREDKQEIDDETYSEIMEIINNIDDWNDVEE